MAVGTLPPLLQPALWVLAAAAVLVGGTFMVTMADSAGARTHARQPDCALASHDHRLRRWTDCRSVARAPGRRYACRRPRRARPGGATAGVLLAMTAIWLYQRDDIAAATKPAIRLRRGRTPEHDRGVGFRRPGTLASPRITPCAPGFGLWFRYELLRAAGRLVLPGAEPGQAASSFAGIPESGTDPLSDRCDRLDCAPASGVLLFIALPSSLRRSRLAAQRSGFRLGARSALVAALARWVVSGVGARASRASRDPPPVDGRRYRQRAQACARLHILVAAPRWPCSFSCGGCRGVDSTGQRAWVVQRLSALLLLVLILLAAPRCLSRRRSISPRVARLAGGAGGR